MGSSLGLWISPTACYHDALNPDWARTNLETFQPARRGRAGSQMCCLGGPRYATAFRTRLVDLVQRYGIRHVKLDGYCLECPESGPWPCARGTVGGGGGGGGHRGVRGGAQSAAGGLAGIHLLRLEPEPVVAVLRELGYRDVRRRRPARARAGTGLSRELHDRPGLLQLARCGADAGADRGAGGVGGDPPDTRAVHERCRDHCLRGHAFLPLYVNPAYMDEGRWKALAQFLRWSRQNAPLLEETTPILPAAWRDGKVPHFSKDETMPREPYGYAHWKKGRGSVALRNPWIAPQTMTLRLDKARRDLGFRPAIGNEKGMKECVEFYKKFVNN